MLLLSVESTILCVKLKPKMNDRISLSHGSIIAKLSISNADAALVSAFNREVTYGWPATCETPSHLSGGRVFLRYVLSCLQIFSHEVLFLSMVLLDHVIHLLGELVLDPAGSNLRDLVVRVRPTYLICPLHLFRLDH